MQFDNLKIVRTLKKCPATKRFHCSSVFHAVQHFFKWRTPKKSEWKYILCFIFIRTQLNGSWKSFLGWEMKFNFCVLCGCSQIEYKNSGKNLWCFRTIKEKLDVWAAMKFAYYHLTWLNLFKPATSYSNSDQVTDYCSIHFAPIKRKTMRYNDNNKNSISDRVVMNQDILNYFLFHPRQTKRESSEWEANSQLF